MKSLMAGMIGCVVGWLALEAAHAETVRIDAFRRGHYRSNGFHSGTQNSSTGYFSNHITHSYFAFDLSPIAGSLVTNATLVLQVVTFEGNQFEHEFEVHDVTSDVLSLTNSYAAGSATGQAIFADLGGGRYYGWGDVPFFPPFSQAPPDRVVPLSSSALQDLSDAAGGLFAVGVKVTTAVIGFVNGVSFSQANVFDPGPWRHYLLLDTIPFTPGPLRIAGMEITNDVVHLDLRGLPIGEPVWLERTSAIMNGWSERDTFVPTGTRTNWSESWGGRVHALYRLTTEEPE